MAGLVIQAFCSCENPIPNLFSSLLTFTVLGSEWKGILVPSNLDDIAEVQDFMQDQAAQELELVIDLGPDVPAGILVQEAVVEHLPAEIVDFNRLLLGPRGVRHKVEGLGEDWEEGVAVRAF